MAKIFGRSKQEKIILGIAFPIILIWSLTLIYVFVWAFLNSLKTTPEYYADTFSLPKEWLFSNWGRAFDELEIPKSNPLYTVNLWGMIFNSLWYMLGGAFLGIAANAMTAYALAKYDFKYCKVLYNLSVAIMMIPIMGSMATQLKLFKEWGISNSPLFLVTRVGALGGSTLLIMYSAFKSIPWSYAESVFIDGGGNWTVFLRIMIPQAMPLLIALFVTACIGGWNDYMTPYLYLPDYPTLATGIFRLEHASLISNNKPVFYAAVLISALPIFILFLIFSDKIMENVSIGGLKG